MENTKELQRRNLPQLQQNDISETKNDNELVSIYPRGRVTAQAFAEGCKQINMAFPELSKDWYRLLDKMLEVDGWNDQRFKDAVLYLIRTFKYPKPAIADILNYDRKEKRFTYHDLLKATVDYEADSRRTYFNYFEKRQDGFWYIKKGNEVYVNKHRVD